MNYLNIIIIFMLGAIMGPSMMKLTSYLIASRINEPPKGLLISKKQSWLIWSFMGAIGFVVISLLTSSELYMIEYMAIYLVLLSLSVVDGSIRRIPNELLLALLIVKIIAIAISGVLSSLLASLVGFVIGWVLFLIPSMLKISIGWGDIKFAAVAGFCIGIMGLFQSMVIMSISLAIYGGYLMLTKKGSLKTKVAIGPPLSLGIFITLLYPIAEMF